MDQEQTTKPETTTENDSMKPEEPKTKRGSSHSSNSSASESSSESSQDEKDQKETTNAAKRRGSPSKSPRRVSKSKSLSKEKQRSLSRSGSNDERRERAKRYNDKSDNRPQNYRGGHQKFREHHDSSKSRSRSPHDRKFRHDKKKTVIMKPTLDGPLWSFRQFMESQRYEIDSYKAEKVYQKYKKEYEDKQYSIFFAEHKNDEWFKEKYDTILSEKLKEERRAEAQVNAEKFSENVKEAVFENLNLNYEDYDHKTLVNEHVPRVNNELVEEEKDGSKALNNFTEISVEANIDITKAPFFGFDPNSQTLFIKAIPKNISRWDLIEAFKKLSGFVSLSLSEPLKSQEFIRFGWILFDTEDNCSKAYEFLKTLNIKGYAFNIVKSRSQRKSLKICENVDKDRIIADVELSRKLIDALDDEKDIQNDIFKNGEQDDPAKQLDLQVLYLRRVHSYCFYCAAEYIDERMLAAKCGPAHLRRFKVSEEETPDLPDWHKRIAEILKTRIEESARKPKRTLDDIEKKAEQEFDEILKSKCEKVSMKHGNWPCKYCHKIFKEDHFVIKHVKTKHGEKYAKIREKRMYDNYAADKNKITATLGGGYPSNRNYSRPPGQQGNYRGRGGRGGYHGNRGSSNRQNFEYRDLDDPKVSQTRTNRAVIDYGDL